jgi:phosphoribosylformylglycinamidine cyclo-ligase
MTAPAATYKDAGVDIDAANTFIRKIKPLVKETERPEVLSSIGHYAGLFALDKSKWRDPVLVASTDGVGTKLKLALEWRRLEGLGQDLVAMSANDILCLGAEPLFFLDYFATGRLEIKTASVILEGIAKACREIRCALLGGETAEMPKIYRGKDFDLAGFVVGIVEKGEIVDGSRIDAGDQVIGIASSGPHSNGYSLIRKIIRGKKVPKTLRESLLAPTRLYVNLVKDLKQSFPLHGIAHITGGGLLENLPRLFPDRCRGILHKNSWPRPPVFQQIQKWGRVPEEEMNRVFNCGIGLMLVVPSRESEAALRYLRERNEQAWRIGEIRERGKGAAPLEIL